MVVHEVDGMKVKSLGKALAILDCFIEKQPMGVTEISDRLSLYKSNVSDIVSTFVAAGYLEKDEMSGKYYLGLEALRLGRAAAEHNTFQSITSIHIRQIAQESGERVYLTIPRGYNVYYLDTADPSNETPFFPIAVTNDVDSLNTTSSGKVMLAYMPESFVDEYLSTPLTKLTDNTITDPDRMRMELLKIRSCGYAIDDMENAIGLTCVAVPLFNSEEELLGAISISGPSPRFTSNRIEEYVKLLKQHAQMIKQLL